MNIKYLTSIVTMLAVQQGFALPTMQLMNDEQMAASTGQALFNSTYIPPGTSTLGGTNVTNPNTDIGFYKLGMSAQLDLNANIKKMQLGCGGFKGPGCDIDLDNVSFTGITKTGVQSAGVPTDFTLINPALEVAIKNPQNAALREVVGLRFAADESWGMLSIGDGGANPNDVASNTGINSLTGHMPTYLKGIKIPTYICFAAKADHTACADGTTPPANQESTIDADVPNKGDNRFDFYFNRNSRVYLSGMKAKAVLGATINSNLDESLKYIHNIQVGTDPNKNNKYDAGEGAKNFGLSVQGQNLQWYSNGQWLRADKGWWLESAPAEMGNFTTATVYADLGNLFVDLNLKDLNQNSIPVNNCWGNLKFC